MATINYSNTLTILFFGGTQYRFINGTLDGTDVTKDEFIENLRTHHPEAFAE